MNLNELSPDVRRDGRTFALVHERIAWAEVLSAFGEFDLSVADELQAAIAAQLRGTLPLVLDLTFCDYLDSTILRVLVRTMRAGTERVGIIVPRSSRIYRIFEMTRLDEMLQVAYSRDELHERFVLD